MCNEILRTAHRMRQADEAAQPFSFMHTRVCYNSFMRLKKKIFCVIIASLLFSHLLAGVALAQTPAPAQDYLVYVVSESADEIALVRFGPKGARVDHKLGTGVMPSDLDGPHGMAISRDKEFYFVSLAHGAPFGSVWKYSAKDDALLGKVTLGMFPATMDVSPDGQFLYVVNFNLHGDMVPSSVSVVSTELMTELARITTCTMPHGSRFNPQGTKHYSVCMMDDMLVEIDTSTLKVSRYFVLTKGKEMGMTGAPKAPAKMDMPGMNMGGTRDTGGHGLEAPKPGDVSCSPTWAQPSTDGSKIYVACNKSSEIVEIDAASWKMTRRIPTGPGVYNLAVTKDGRLIGTNKRGPSVSVIDLKSGKELARIPTKRRVVHGAVVSPDDRYAFISEEGIGSDPGTVEVIDLQSLESVATVDVGAQAGGIDFLRMEPAK
ncbi:MAG: YncE family protein [Pyrinomonadaceae bacterium]|nr:YncE family protein [Pyrinomonadaceae bacterium]